MHRIIFCKREYKKLIVKTTISTIFLILRFKHVKIKHVWFNLVLRHPTIERISSLLFHL